MTQITISLSGAKGYEFMDFGLPYPNRIFHANRDTVYITWLIEGYFHTKTNREYLNDIISRLLISFREYNPSRIVFKQRNLQNNIEHSLKEFAGLDSIRKIKFIPQRASSFEDHTFWAIKLYAEDCIRRNGFLIKEDLTDWAIEQFEEKELSTIRAKARSIYDWYEERNFQLSKNTKYTKEEYREIRRDRFYNIAKSRALNTKRKIEAQVKRYFKMILLNIQNISKLSKILKVSRNTVYKYLYIIKHIIKCQMISISKNKKYSHVIVKNDIYTPQHRIINKSLEDYG